MYVNEYELGIREYTNDGTGFSNGLRQIIKSVITTTGEFLQYNKTAGTHWLHDMMDQIELKQSSTTFSIVCLHLFSISFN
jgi:hypothetical protein